MDRFRRHPSRTVFGRHLRMTQGRPAMPDTPHLGLPLIEAAQAQKHVTHNEALVLLDTLVQLAVASRSLSAPPASPAEGDRYIVKATGIGAFAGKDNQLAQFSSGGWLFYPPRVGWLAFIADEGVLVVWDGNAWVSAVSSSGDITELQNLLRLGVGTEADATNPFSAKLNNALWTAKTTGEGGDGALRYKLSKEDASKTLSFLFQDNFSGRAEIGLCGDDDFHFKVSPDGSTWIDALILDQATGAAKLNAALHLAADISPPQIAADQNDFSPAGLPAASVLRLSSDATRSITSLAGGERGRILALVNVGVNPIILQDESAASIAANRFAFGGDVTLAAKQCAVLWYDAADARWKLMASPQAGAPATLAESDIVLAQLALGVADALNSAQFMGLGGNHFADSFDTLTYVDVAAAINLDTGTPGMLKPTAGSSNRISNATPSMPNGGTAANINDDNVNTGATTSALPNWTSESDPNNRVIAKLDFGSNRTIDKIEVKGVSHSSTGTAGTDHGLYYSIDGSTWTLYGGNFSLTSTPSDAVRTGSPVTARYVAYISGQVNWAGTYTITLKDLNAYEVSPPGNLTVASTALAAVVAPSSMKVMARAKFVDPVAINTDYKISVSRDGGATWTYAVLNDRFTVNGVHTLESDTIDVSGQPSGTQVKWRIETVNNRMVETSDIFVRWE
jgi:hypothetical protein